jgi:DNA-binding beta-propeller fold protein YncE
LSEILGPGNLKWNKTGITIIGNGYGSKPDQFEFPQGLFIEPKTQIIYVTDASNNRVQKLYPNGKIKTAAGQSSTAGGSAPNQLDGPKSVFADENENVYVADWNNQRIQFWQKDATSGTTVAGDGKRGTALSEFSYPSIVSVDSKKNVIVADFQNQRITQWPPKYDPKISIGTLMAVSFSLYHTLNDQFFVVIVVLGWKWCRP